MTDMEMLRYTVATLAYRAGKTMRTAPASFANFKAKPDSNSPVQIVAHLGDLFDWALTMAKGETKWRSDTPRAWEVEVTRFFESLRAFDEYLASGAPLKAELGKLFQGPIADALTHTGQLAMLRRLAGCPMKGENYTKADIVLGRVGIEQTPANPANEFD
jgi:hypothetical protein